MLVPKTFCLDPEIDRFALQGWQILATDACLCTAKSQSAFVFIRKLLWKLYQVLNLSSLSCTETSSQFHSFAFKLIRCNDYSVISNSAPLVTLYFTVKLKQIYESLWMAVMHVTVMSVV